MESTDKPGDGMAEPSKEDDLVWQFYADLINSGHYDVSDPSKLWKGSYTTALAKSHTRLVLAGDEDSSASDEELIAALPHTHFQPIE